MDPEEIRKHDEEMGFARRTPDSPSSDWPVAVSFVGFLALIGFVIWIFAR